MSNFTFYWNFDIFGFFLKKKKRLKISKLWKSLIEFAMKNKTCFKVEEELGEMYFKKLDENPERFLIEKFDDFKKTVARKTEVNEK